MSFETALRERMKSFPDFAATGSSCEWVKRPQGSDYPATVLHVLLEPRVRTMTAFRSARAVQIQFDTMALSAPVKVALRESVIAAIAPAMTIERVRFGRAQDVAWSDLSEQTETVFVHRDRITATLWYRELET